MEKFLKDLIASKKEQLKGLQERSNASEDLNEVRSIGTQIEAVMVEIRNAETQLAALEVRDFNPIATYGVQNSNVDENAGTTDSVEYRSAFMNYVLRNTAIPAEVRANANTLTGDVKAAIPNVLVNRIVEKMEHSGMILSRVSRTAYAAGVTIPTSNIKPVATWVAEGATSDKQKKTLGSITFAYHKLRCEISMSMEVGTMALAAFEAKFVENVAKAMVIAIEKAILNGDGATMPKGILKEEGTAKTIAAAVPTFEELIDIEAAVDVAYEGTALWLLTKAQFANFLKIMDKNGQPVARVNYGIAGNIERTLLGREVLLHPYAEEVAGVAGIIVDLNDYALNTVYDMGISKKQDWDTEDLLTKAVMSVDGKLVDATSLIKITAAA